MRQGQRGLCSDMNGLVVLDRRLYSARVCKSALMHQIYIDRCRRVCQTRDGRDEASTPRWVTSSHTDCTGAGAECSGQPRQQIFGTLAALTGCYSSYCVHSRGEDTHDEVRRDETSPTRASFHSPEPHHHVVSRVPSDIRAPSRPLTSHALQDPQSLRTPTTRSTVLCRLTGPKSSIPYRPELPRGLGRLRKI